MRGGISESITLFSYEGGYFVFINPFTSASTIKKNFGGNNNDKL